MAHVVHRWPNAGRDMLTASRTWTAFRQANKLLLLTRRRLLELKFPQRCHICSELGSMVHSGNEQGVAVAGGGGEGEPVLKSAKQLKKDADEDENMRNFNRSRQRWLGSRTTQGKRV